MKVITLKYPFNTKICDSNIILALGFFDGVHIGHQALIKDAKKIAQEKGLPLVVMTFVRHPKEIYKKDKKFVYLDTQLEKENKMESLGVDYLLVVHFDENFSKLAPQQFVDDIIVGLHTDTVVAGFDYTYGPKDVANIDNLPKFAKDRFKIVVEPEQTFAGIKVGSTEIRRAIQDGNVSLAMGLLDKPYQTSGIIVRGFRRGHKIGFPTANLKVEGSKVLPKVGVYATKTKIDGKWYDSMTNVGYNETFANQDLSIETHLFGFNQEAYDKPMTIKWYKFIRGDQKFSGIKALSDQLQRDQKSVQQYFYELKRN